jgi:hypothetical protein
VLEDPLAILSCAAALLGAERICDVWIARAPERFRALCAGSLLSMGDDPITAVAWLFYGFKVVQFAVFAWWCFVFGHGLPVPDRDVRAAATGAATILVGQVLNLSVFYRLGRVGVFYGGHPRGRRRFRSRSSRAPVAATSRPVGNTRPGRIPKSRGLCPRTGDA